MLLFWTKVKIYESRDKSRLIWLKIEATFERLDAFYHSYITEMVVDTTGAGDAFSGALVCFLVEKPELHLGEAIRRACYVASISVQKEGTQSSYPYKKDLPNWLFQWLC